MADRKLSEEQKAIIFRKTLQGEKTADLAREYNVSTKTIRKIKYDPRRLDKAEKAVEARQRFARLRIHDGAMKGIEKEHEILDREVPSGEKGTGLLYLQHQVATGMMDRDGLRAPEKSDQRLEIVFGCDGPDLGMPDENGPSDDGCDPEEEEE